MMTAALGTLPFLAVLWLVVVLGAKVLEESGGKIAAALKGVPSREPTIIAARPRSRARAVQVRSAEPRWRAAA
ncbi:MAG TPA: hypothetical protein VN713_01555 [Sphingomicrobium sp.]|nr:hypothetical protein [Sphingomicrobium sp.]